MPAKIIKYFVVDGIFAFFEIEEAVPIPKASLLTVEINSIEDVASLYRAIVTTGVGYDLFLFSRMTVGVIVGVFGVGKGVEVYVGLGEEVGFSEGVDV